jgi:hypothetical protein
MNESNEMNGSFLKRKREECNRMKLDTEEDSTATSSSSSSSISTKLRRIQQQQQQQAVEYDVNTNEPSKNDDFSIRNVVRTNDNVNVHAISSSTSNNSNQVSIMHQPQDLQQDDSNIGINDFDEVLLSKVNPKMHDRNIHKHKPPNFKELARKYPSFAQ